MIRLSMNEVTTYGWSFDEDIANYVNAGYEGIGVCRKKLAMFGEDAGIPLLVESGLKASSLSYCGGFTGGPQHNRQARIKDTAKAIQLACTMDAGCVIVKSGGRAGHTGNHARRLIRDAIAELVPFAEDAQVDLAIEPWHVGCIKQESVLNTLEQALDLVEDIGSSRLRIAFDTYHLGFGEVDLKLIEYAAKHIAIVQLGDGSAPPTRTQNRCSLGDGIVPVGDIVCALIAGGYTGFFEVELTGPDISYKLYNDILIESHNAWSGLAGR
ncbi:MAG: sugar phosphate isomerase/epimerase [Planctomycetales bacterium]|nr:sugar phosphate isomerase/epimerase [Planctomycetales bacterium]